MIRQATVEDSDALNTILAHESVWPWITDDKSPEGLRRRIGTEILKDKDLTVLLGDGGGIAFIAVPTSSVMWTVHTAILPEARGQKAIEAAREAMNWIWKNTSCRKLISWIPVFNRPAVYFALKCGFRKEGVVTKSFLKHGKLYDQFIVGIEKE